jgi:hypothetical protein
MADKRWKAVERNVAKLLGGERIPVTGEREGMDVRTPIFAVQVKHGRKRPSYLRTWLDGIRDAGKRGGGRLGIVVWITNGEGANDGIVMMQASEFAALAAELLERRRQPIEVRYLD